MSRELLAPHLTTTISQLGVENYMIVVSEVDTLLNARDLEEGSPFQSPVHTVHTNVSAERRSATPFV